MQMNQVQISWKRQTDRERGGLQYKRITVKIGLKTNSNDPLNKMDSKMKCKKIQNVKERDGERKGDRACKGFVYVGKKRDSRAYIDEMNIDFEKPRKGICKWNAPKDAFKVKLMRK